LDKKNQNALYNRAWLHAYKGNFPLAEKDYSQAIAVNNKLEDAYFNRGLALIKLKKFGEAINDFTKVIRINPAATDAFCNRGNAYFKLGKKGLALMDYNNALKIDPKDADIYYNRAFLHLSRGQKDAATADFKRASALGQDRARKHLELPPARPKTIPKTSIAKRKLKPANVKMSSGNASGIASGTIHGTKFRVQKATLANGILTLRQGKDFFPDQAVMIFLFLKDGETADGKVYDVSRDQGFGAPHIHMKWKEEGEKLPKTQIYMKDYIMRLEFGKARNGTLSGKIVLALPDEHQSEVNGTFRAELK
jgi:tetratricopeptide (TPR) repeat protein